MSFTAFQLDAFQVFDGFQADLIDTRQPGGGLGVGGGGGRTKFVRGGREYDRLEDAFPEMPEIRLPVIPVPIEHGFGLPPVPPDLSPLLMQALQQRADDEALALLLLAA